MSICLLNNIFSYSSEAVGSHCVQHVSNTQLTSSAVVETLQQCRHLVFTDFNSERLHAKSELCWVSHLTDLLQVDSEMTKAIGWRLLQASLDRSLGNVRKVGHCAFLLDVWISYVQVFSYWFSEIDSRSFLVEVDVAVVSAHWLCLIGSLSETASSGEWIWADGCRHIVVLSFLHMSIVGDWLSLSVITLRNSLPKLIITGLLESTPSSVFNN